MAAVPIEPCFNSDVILDGSTYHVQTEDWGDHNPFIVTRVFRSGAVLASVKTSYDKILSLVPATGRQAIRLGMREQHQAVLDQLVNGGMTQSLLK